MLAGLLLAALAVATPPAPPVSVPPSRAARVVAILPMTGEMDSISTESLSMRARQAREAGADAVVIALDTPGGEMLSTLELCRRIKGEFPPNTIAWIRPRAFSAGTIAALACREIVVTPDAVFGDAAPYHAQALETMPERYTPAVRLRLEMARYVLAEDYVRALEFGMPPATWRRQSTP